MIAPSLASSCAQPALTIAAGGGSLRSREANTRPRTSGMPSGPNAAPPTTGPPARARAAQHPRTPGDDRLVELPLRDRLRLARSGGGGAGRHHFNRSAEAEV